MTSFKFTSWVVTVVALGMAGNAGAEESGTGLGRHKQLYAVPAPAPVVIDGLLDEWDLSGQIEMFVIGETKSMQSAKFAVMYDQDALYLSGVVRDPSPMMNRHDPRVSGDAGWDADACQFRITRDPAMPYPVKIGYGDGDMEDQRLVHLTMWNYTDREEACLQVQTSMNYAVPVAAWKPFGVVPASGFTGKYRKAADGFGYTFEYRIPWSTLGAQVPLKGGDSVAGTVQFNWGQTDGLHTAGGSAWAYDGMAGPGFTFQNAAVWGRVHFSEKGPVPREKVEAGVPAERPLPLEFAYELPEDGQITLQLVDQQHLVRRILVAQGDRRAGPNREQWDGMDDHGLPLTAGSYRVEGIIHKPITGKFLFSVHNSGILPYPTDDGTGGWGGDHGNPRACSAVPGGMLLAWDVCEFGWGIIKVDDQGRKQWGSKANAVFLANDGKRFFTYDPHSFHGETGIQAFDIADGRQLNFSAGDPVLRAPPGGSVAADEVSGLAYASGKVFVSYGKRDLIGVFDAATGALQASWKVTAPGALAARGDSSLIGISNGALVALADGIAKPLGSVVLDEPAGIAVAADGTIYVSNHGVQQDIAVLSADGALLRRVGKAGGRPVSGRYDAAGMYRPEGIAVDATGRLWVAEDADGPKRISVWKATDGLFEREFFGGSGYFGYAFIDPAKPGEIYCHNVMWSIDWDTGATTPLTTIWRKTAPDMIEEPIPDGFANGTPFRIITAANGRQYGIGAGQMKTILYRRDGDLFKPFIAAFSVSRGWSLYGGQGIPYLDDATKTPDGSYIWQDENDDQRVQPHEVHAWSGAHPKAIAPDMTVWLSNGGLLKPAKWLGSGQPVYDLDQVAPSFLTGSQHASEYLWLDGDAVYTLAQGQLSRWNADGSLAWGYPGIPGWHDSLGLPVVKPGRLHGLTGGLGVAGSFTGNMTYFGPCHLFDRNGMYTGMIMRDGRLGGLGPDIGQPEGQGGALVSVVTKPGTAPRTMLLAGGQDGRVTEVLGLDTVKPLPSKTFVLTAEQSKIAVDAQRAYAASIGTNLKLVIGSSLEASPAASRSLDGARRFTVKLARDAQHLLVVYEVVAPSALITAVTDPSLMFKSGNCLDIQIATDATVDPKRATPAPGDVRLLVSRQAEKAYAVLYRPKVAGAHGQPTVLHSPTGSESFDEISRIEGIGLDYRKTCDGFTAVVSIPLTTIGLTLEPGRKVRMDLGYLYGNATGTQTAARSYLFNNSFTANVVNDVPHESRLEPAHWGEAEVR